MAAAMTVDWWLVGLSFALGLVLTSALLFGRRAACDDERPTTKIPAADAPTVKLPGGRSRWRRRRRG
ncbi:hypothetical protein A5700_15515 [Mycobacterium sp. E1214]|nr:hypothetical protein A5700_15515 [Mycobacterium sp. E1214]OBH26910.1 hypothetical protein A5693_02615 [Mycobacterium sp. E1319]